MKTKCERVFFWLIRRFAAYKFTERGTLSCRSQWFSIYLPTLVQFPTEVGNLGDDLTTKSPNRGILTGEYLFFVSVVAVTSRKIKDKTLPWEKYKGPHPLQPNQQQILISLAIQKHWLILSNFCMHKF